MRKLAPSCTSGNTTSFVRLVFSVPPLYVPLVIRAGWLSRNVGISLRNVLTWNIRLLILVGEIVRVQSPTIELKRFSEDCRFVALPRDTPPCKLPLEVSFERLKPYLTN